MLIQEEITAVPLTPAPPGSGGSGGPKASMPRSTSEPCLQSDVSPIRERPAHLPRNGSLHSDIESTKPNRPLPPVPGDIAMSRASSGSSRMGSTQTLGSPVGSWRTSPGRGSAAEAMGERVGSSMVTAVGEGMSSVMRTTSYARGAAAVSYASSAAASGVAELSSTASSSIAGLTSTASSAAASMGQGVMSVVRTPVGAAGSVAASAGSAAASSVSYASSAAASVGEGLMNAVRTPAGSVGSSFAWIGGGVGVAEAEVQTPSDLWGVAMIPEAMADGGEGRRGGVREDAGPQTSGGGHAFTATRRKVLQVP